MEHTLNEAWPRVSVIIPTRNRKDLALRAINSALRQENCELQVVVVDDGSEDGTADFLRGCFGERLTLIEKEYSTGNADARNFAFAHCKATFVALLDDDDWWTDSRKLDKQLSLMESNPKLGLTGTWWYELTQDMRLEHKKPQLPSTRYQMLNSMLAGGGLTVSSTAVISRVAWHSVGGMDVGQVKGNDSDLFRRITLAGFDISILPEFTTIVDASHGQPRMTPAADRGGQRRELVGQMQALRKHNLLYLRYPQALSRRLRSIARALFAYLFSRAQQ